MNIKEKDLNDNEQNQKQEIDDNELLEMSQHSIIEEDKSVKLKDNHRRREVDLSKAFVKKGEGETQENKEEAQIFTEGLTGLKMSIRRLTDEHIATYTSAHDFVPISKIDSFAEDTALNKQNENESNQRPYFTIGVVVELSNLMKSKKGKAYCNLKLSDLNKYDMSKVNKLLAHAFDNQDCDAQKIAKKCFNSNGYKTMRIIAFGDVANKLSKCSTGLVMGILNPRLMSSNPEQGQTFCIDIESQIFQIGLACDLGFCKGTPKNF